MTDSPAELLRRHGLRPKHSWGQNFLGDDSVLHDIADAADLSPGEAVVELGAGLGHLTRFLLATKATVTAVERDRDLAEVLRTQNIPGLKLVEGNAADLDFAKTAGTSPVVVVGNLPYHLTSPILFQVLDQAEHVSRAVFTVQKEVAVRLAAVPGNRDYGLLTVLLNLFFEVESLFNLPAHLFHPPPKVDSAVIRLVKLPKPRAEVNAAHFRRVVKASFAQRRKTILNSLKSDASLGTAEQFVAALAQAGIDSTRRAETVSSEEFAKLEQALEVLAPPKP